jgi:hypothetical protein
MARISWERSRNGGGTIRLTFSRKNRDPGGKRLLVSGAATRVSPGAKWRSDNQQWHLASEARYVDEMGINLNISDSVIEGLRIPEAEIPQRLRTELAIALYAQGALSLGLTAADLSYARSE